MGNRLLIVAGTNEALHNLPSQLNATIEVKVVEMANEVLWEMRSDPPAAIIAGLDLPDMSGLDLAEILPNFDVPTRIVLVSATPNPEARQHAEELGVYGFLIAASSEMLIDAIYDVMSQPFEIPPPPVEDLATPVPTLAPFVERPAPVIERIERTPAPVERPASEIERPAPVIERIERPPLPPSEPTPPEPVQSPQRRIIPNPDPPYQPPTRPSSRRVMPTRSTPSPTASPSPPPSTASGRLAERARESRAGQAARSDASATPSEASAPQARYANTTVIDQRRASRIQGILSDLWQSLSAQCALLTDRAGMILAQHGDVGTMPMMILLPLLSTSFSTAGEVARQLREEDAMTLYMHDGARYNLYCFDIAQRFLLVVVFDKHIASTRIGSVWVEARSTIRKLNEVLK